MVVTGALGLVDNLHMEWHRESSYRYGREPKMISKLATAITLLGKKLWMGCAKLRHVKLRGKKLEIYPMRTKPPRINQNIFNLKNSTNLKMI